MSDDKYGSDMPTNGTRSTAESLTNVNTDKLAGASAESLWKLVDTDGSGSIDFNEFKKMHSVIVRNAKEDLALEHQQREDNKKWKRYACVLAGAVFLMMLGNAALTCAVVLLAKDTKVESDGVMKGKNGAAIKVENPGFTTASSKAAAAARRRRLEFLDEEGVGGLDDADAEVEYSKEKQGEIDSESETMFVDEEGLPIKGETKTYKKVVPNLADVIFQMKSEMEEDIASEGEERRRLQTLLLPESELTEEQKVERAKEKQAEIDAEEEESNIDKMTSLVIEVSGKSKVALPIKSRETKTVYTKEQEILNGKEKEILVEGRRKLGLLVGAKALLLQKSKEAEIEFQKEKEAEIAAEKLAEAKEGRELPDIRLVKPPTEKRRLDEEEEDNLLEVAYAKMKTKEIEKEADEKHEVALIYVDHEYYKSVKVTMSTPITTEEGGRRRLAVEKATSSTEVLNEEKTELMAKEMRKNVDELKASQEESEDLATSTTATGDSVIESPHPPAPPAPPTPPPPPRPPKKAPKLLFVGDGDPIDSVTTTTPSPIKTSATKSAKKSHPVSAARIAEMKAEMQEDAASTGQP